MSIAALIEQRLADRFTAAERDRLRGLLAACSKELEAIAAEQSEAIAASRDGRP